MNAETERILRERAARLRLLGRGLKLLDERSIHPEVGIEVWRLRWAVINCYLSTQAELLTAGKRL